MSYGSMRKQLADTRSGDQEARFSSRCHADHCPCRGTVSVEGGKFCCAAHAFVAPDRWPMITERLNEFSWIVEFIDEIKKIDRRNGNWRGFAKQFWDGQDAHCLPDERENFIPYECRMRGELLYRCGLAKRPAPRLPQVVTRRGNAASFLGKPA